MLLTVWLAGVTLHIGDLALVVNLVRTIQFSQTDCGKTKDVFSLLTGFGFFSDAFGTKWRPKPILLNQLV